MKYYFEKSAVINGDDEAGAYTRDYFIEKMKEEGLTEIEVYPAVMMKGEDYAWCSEFQDFTEVRSGDCGRFCDKYGPRNGKNGRCKYSKNCYEPDENKLIIIKFK
jgi:hypothetical protein